MLAAGKIWASVEQASDLFELASNIINFFEQRHFLVGLAQITQVAFGALNGKFFVVKQVFDVQNKLEILFPVLTLSRRRPFGIDHFEF